MPTEQTEQAVLPLAPEEPPDLTQRMIHADELCVRETPRPSAALRHSVATWGVLQSVLVHYDEQTKQLVVIEGNRRVLAAREAGIEVSCLVTTDLGYLKHVATVMLNSTRERNPVAELDAIEALMERGATIEQIAKEVGLSVATIKKRLRAQTIIPEIRREIDSGRIAPGIVERIAKLSKAEQDALVDDVWGDDRERKARITADDVKRVRTAVVQQTAIDLPPDVFGDGPTGGEPVDRIADLDYRVELLVTYARALDLRPVDLANKVKAEFARQTKAGKDK